MKIPQNAFEVYAGMGTKRSYRAVAEIVGVSKTAIVKCAKRENWNERLLSLEGLAKKKVERRVLDSMVESIHSEWIAGLIVIGMDDDAIKSICGCSLALISHVRRKSRRISKRE